MPKIGHYEIIRMMGVTELTMLYLGRHIYLNNPVILEASPTSDNQNIENRLKFLAQLLSRLRHPQILRITDAFEDSKNMYLVFEWSEDLHSLETILKKQESMQLDEILKISLEISNVLNYLQHQGVVHQNIQPCNILLGQNTFYLGGFNLANTIEKPFEEYRQKLGDARYAAPEWFLREPICFEQDVWSLGICMYRMFAGQFPFEGQGPREVNGEIIPAKEVGTVVLEGKYIPLEKIAPNIPINIIRLVDRMISRKKEDRPKLAEIMSILEGQLYMTPLTNAFIAMPFHPQFNRVYDSIRTICQKCRVKPIRVDENIMPSNIWQDIEQGIKKASFTIADLSVVPGPSQSNPNVTFEVGLANSLGKPTILLTQDVNTLPFDFRQQRCLVYSNNEGSLQELENKIMKVIHEILKNLQIG